MTYIYTLTDTPRGDVVAQIGHECHGPMTEEIASERALFAESIASPDNGRMDGGLCRYPVIALLMCGMPPAVVMAPGRRYESVESAAKMLNGVLISSPTHKHLTPHHANINKY